MHWGEQELYSNGDSQPKEQAKAISRTNLQTKEELQELKLRLKMGEEKN